MASNKIKVVLKKHRNEVVVSSQFQTTNWRKQQKWYKNGKSNECEKFQWSVILSLGVEMSKTNERINYESLTIQENSNPLLSDDGFEWSENFDGKSRIGDRIYYFNLKFICDRGGAQTRTLRDVYMFIKHQISIINKEKSENTYFINILDGDGSYHHLAKFKHLLKLLDSDFSKNLLIIDLKQFIETHRDYMIFSQKVSNIYSII